MNGGVDGKDKKNKKDKTDKQAKKEHRNHHHNKAIPSISLADRIVKEMHADPLPSPTTPKLTSVKPAALGKQEAPKMVLTTSSVEQLGVIATLLKWIKQNVLQPTFSRQKQISEAYSKPFLQTMTAIQKRFSANDARIEETVTKPQALRFSGANEDKSVTVELGVTTTTPKPTLH